MPTTPLDLPTIIVAKLFQLFAIESVVNPCTVFFFLSVHSHTVLSAQIKLNLAIVMLKRVCTIVVIVVGYITLSFIERFVFPHKQALTSEEYEYV